MYHLQAFRQFRNRATHTAITYLTSSRPNHSQLYATEGVGTRASHSLPFATLNVEDISGTQPAEVHNLVQGNWIKASSWNTILDPLNGEAFIKVAEVQEPELQPFLESMIKCPKHGLHNPFKAPERYLMLGDISAKAAHMLSLPEVI